MKRTMKQFFSFKNSASRSKKSQSASDIDHQARVASTSPVPATKQPSPSLTTVNAATPRTEQDHITPVQTHAQLSTTQELAPTVSLSLSLFPDIRFNLDQGHWCTSKDGTCDYQYAFLLIFLTVFQL